MGSDGTSDMKVQAVNGKWKIKEMENKRKTRISFFLEYEYTDYINAPKKHSYS